MKFALSCDENPGDPGAVHNGIVERDLNIEVATAAAAALIRCGQQVWADFSITYAERVAAANSNGSDVLVACAHNASSSPGAEGAQLIICPGGDGILRQAEVAGIVGAQLVADGIAAAWSIYHEAVTECCAFDRASVYVEFLFETNPRDVARIHTAGYPHDAGESLARGLAKAYGFAYVAEHTAPPIPTPAPEPVPAPPVAPVPLPTPAPIPPTPAHDPLPPPPIPAGTGWTWDGSAWVGGIPPIVVPPITPAPLPEPAPVAEAGVTTSEWLLAVRYLQQLLAVGTVAVFVKISSLACPLVASVFSLGNACASFHPGIPADLLTVIVGLEGTAALGVAGYAVSRGIRKAGTTA